MRPVNACPAEVFVVASRNPAWARRHRVADLQSMGAGEPTARVRAELDRTWQDQGDALAPADLIVLPEADPVEMGLGLAIEQRQSSRRFADGPLTLAAVATLLQLGAGVRNRGLPVQRNVPSAGNLGSCELYLVSLAVADLPPGLYGFQPHWRGLRPIERGNFRHWIDDRVFLQEEFAQAAAVLVMVSRLGQLTSRYGPRGGRLALLDAGHVSQNMHLIAAALGLAACATAGFIDDELNQALRLDGVTAQAVLCLAVGLPG